MQYFPLFTIICLLIFTTPLRGTESSRSQILYLMHKGEIEQGLTLYDQFFKETGSHDFEILQQLGISLLQEGSRSHDPEIVLLSLFGAGVSTDERVLSILERGLESDYPQIQLASLNFLARQQNDRADEALKEALASPHILLRLEAAHDLAAKKHASAVGQVEALMAKVDSSLKVVFPRLFAMIGTDKATKALRRLMNDPKEKVRVEAILSTAEFNRDDLLPQIRILVTQHGTSQLEACAIALGKMKDTQSIAKLEKLTHNQAPQVQLAAYNALYQLGQEQAKLVIEEFAKQQDPFAITLLGEIKGSEKTLQTLSKSNHIHTRINASIALLERQDPQCLFGLCEILVHDARDLGITPIFTLGRGLKAWKVIPSAHENFKENPFAAEISTSIREQLLRKTIDLPEKYFLELAQLLFETQQNALIPTLVELLENLHTPAAIDILKRQQQKVGAPLIRNYCNLALYRMKVNGPYADNLRNWVLQKEQEELIRFRPFVPAELRVDSTASYQLTPEETSRLLVESIEALAKSQDAEAIEVLLHAIRHGNAKNRYALAGLLIRMTL